MTASVPKTNPKPRRKRSASTGPLSRTSIIAAAVELADRDGLERLSMRGLAGRLGVEAMSLYNHVADKEDLIDAMVDCVAGEIRRPTQDAFWRTALRQSAVSAHETLLRHGWACPLIGLRLNVGPNMLACTEATLACLVEAGFTHELADHAMNAIDNHVRGFTLQALSFPIAPKDYAQAARDYLPSLPPGTCPQLRRLAEKVLDGSYDGLNNFPFGLDLILDGLERLLLNPGAAR
jgi:AcrR family transcriptional regulator